MFGGGWGTIQCFGITILFIFGRHSFVRWIAKDPTKYWQMANPTIQLAMSKMIQWGFSSGSGIGSYSSHSLHPSFHASQRPDSVNKAKNFFATFFLFFLPFFRVSTQFYFLACWQLHILNNEFAWSAIPSRRCLRHKWQKVFDARRFSPWWLYCWRLGLFSWHVYSSSPSAVDAKFGGYIKSGYRETRLPWEWLRTDLIEKKKHLKHE